MPSPLYDALHGYAGCEPLRFHMPGHKGKFLPVPELAGLAAIDVTELPPTGNLYEAGEPFHSAQRLWADLFGFENCQFLTGGSTMGIHTGLALCARPGEKVLMDRSCHRAAFNALALLDLEPVWLERPWLTEENLIGPIFPEYVEKMLCRNLPHLHQLLSPLQLGQRNSGAQIRRPVIPAQRHMSFVGRVLDVLLGNPALVDSDTAVAQSREPAQADGKLRVIGRDNSALSRRHVLRRLEAERRDMRGGTDNTSFIVPQDTLRIVLNDGQPVLLRQGHDWVDVSGQAVKRNRNDRFCPLRDFLFHTFHRKGKGLRVNIREYRDGIGLQYADIGTAHGEGRDNDLIPLPYAGRLQGGM